MGGLADWFAITAFFQKVFIFPHTDILIDYLTKFHGQEKIIRVSRLVVRKFLENLDLQTVIKKLEPDMRQFLKRDTADTIIPKFINKIISSRHTVNFYRVLLELSWKT